MKKFADPAKLALTENNKMMICETATDFMDVKTLAPIIGLSESRVSVICKHLVEDGYLIYDDRTLVGESGFKHKRRFFKAVKTYVPIEYDVKPQGKYYRPNNYYGVGKIDNPWQPKIPEGGTPVLHKLMENKSNDYFSRPLKKAKPVSIGSTFSLMDGVTA